MRIYDSLFIDTDRGDSDIDVTGYMSSLIILETNILKVTPVNVLSDTFLYSSLNHFQRKIETLIHI